MAKRRILKKEISYVAGELFSEVLVCKLFIPGVEGDKADVLLTRILDMQDEFMVMPASVALQLLAYYVSSDKGFDVDKPRNLAKVVTVE